MGEASDRYLLAQPGIEAATLNATVGLIMTGNIAVFCLTATRMRWLTNAQALPVVLCSFLLAFYDLTAYASDQERRALLDALNSTAYRMHLPEAVMAALAVAVGTAFAQRTTRRRSWAEK